ncbi:MAG: hypothetical protein NWF06_03770 [Candidatus Bathyarchaeota archaeon]|nr:hypothetical protein [Candidatus Bathyarchaeum sp.]
MSDATTVRVHKKTHEGIKELVEFFECTSQDELLKHGCLALIERALERATDRETIEKLCTLRRELVPKIV